MIEKRSHRGGPRKQRGRERAPEKQRQGAPLFSKTALYPSIVYSETSRNVLANPLGMSQANEVDSQD